ncbi:MAG: DUF2027 domain-containing protein [Bacteroidales bacterium]|nr:DUF2027 domain-containing protein [Bacteroidales bacterium]MBN2821031.1 DUF2027 domain-containing protein [Bacteroidales bacterium]
MNYKIGDKVRFLNDVGGGVIVAYVDDKTVSVETDDGFEIPVLANEILLDISEVGPESLGSKQNNKEEDAPVVKIKTEDYRYKEFKGQVLLAIVPENDKLLHVSDLMLYIINDSNFSLQFIVSHNDSHVFEFVDQGVVEPDTKQLVRKYTQSGLGKIKEIKLQAYFFKEGLYDPQPPLNKLFTVDDISFYKAAVFSDNEYFNNKAYIFDYKEADLKEAVEQLSKSDFIKVAEEKSKKEVKLQAKKRVPNGPEEVDLHIEAIVDDFAGLSNGEIVDIQMGRFETALETALRSKAERIVFIHGVGNGKLKHDLRNKLDRKYPDLKYQDASFKEYGYGATMVSFK